MSDNKSIKFLYETVLGRCILKALVHPGVSKAAAKYLSSSQSAWIVPKFVKNHGIDLTPYVVPEGGYKSFNDFFTRNIKEEYVINSQAQLISPSDGLLTVSKITPEGLFFIKHTQYDLKALLKDEELANEFMGGSAFIFRLTPTHYHHYFFCTSGKILKNKVISGILHSVQPVCHEHYQVFAENSREYVVIEHPSLGKVIQMEVGALLVGKITNIPGMTEATVATEKGYFEYGGSSIAVLTKEPYELTEEIANRPKVDGEIPVRIGERLIEG